MTNGLLEKIKSRGYWRINFQPLTAKVRLDTMQACQDIVRSNLVHLRGWDYPHYPLRNDDHGGTAPAGEYFEGWEDFGVHKEFWRMYKSGQFLYYRALREDWIEEEGWFSNDIKEIKPGEKLGVAGTVIYEITEVFEFLSRLTQSNLYNEGVRVSLSIKGTEGRELWVEDRMRAPFMFARKTSAPEINVSQEYTADEIVQNPKKLANDVILSVFDVFGWSPSPEQIEKDQDRALTGNL